MKDTYVYIDKNSVENNRLYMNTDGMLLVWEELRAAVESAASKVWNGSIEWHAINVRDHPLEEHLINEDGFGTDVCTDFLGKPF
jgi:hypothetical protein